MVILGFIVSFLLFAVHLFIPFNYQLFDSYNLDIFIPYKGMIIFYLVGIMFFIHIIYLLIKYKYFNYDFLFLIMTIWISNFIGYIYFNIFESIILSFFSFLICLSSLGFFIKKIKKTNKSYLKYLFILLIFYFYLLIVLFNFLIH